MNNVIFIYFELHFIIFATHGCSLLRIVDYVTNKRVNLLLPCHPPIRNK